jgi:hypothetical protein
LQKLDSGEYVINSEDKANILNNVFCSIAEIENSNVPTPDFHDRTGNGIEFPMGIFTNNSLSGYLRSFNNGMECGIT